MPPKRLYLLVIVLSLAGYGWLFYNIATPEHEHSSVCLMKTTTGIPCPACGSTRSAQSILEGNFTEAFLINPFGYLIVGMLSIFPFWILLDLIKNKTSFYTFYISSEKTLQRKFFYISGISLVILNWIWNINKGL